MRNRKLPLPLLLRAVLLRRGAARDSGVALPVAVVAALALLIGIAALSSRNVSGFIASAFQGQNRAARDLSESAISAFMTTMNQEENRYLLVAGEDQNWGSGNTKHRNPCTLFDEDGNLKPGVNPATIEAAYKAGTMSDAAATTADDFIVGDQWRNFEGDPNRQYRIAKVEYKYENAGKRESFEFNTNNENFPSEPPITVRDSVLAGGSRSLLRVTVEARVLRDGKEVSRSRVARELEVVPKCCKRSFGGNTYGGLSEEPWGSDTRVCRATFDDEGDNGIVTGLNGGGPVSSKNQLDIVDQDGKLVTSAICVSGSDGEKSVLNPSLDTENQKKCDNNQLTLGAASKTKPGISFTPQPFDLTLPRPWFGEKTYAGQILPLQLGSGGTSNSAPLNTFSQVQAVYASFPTVGPPPGSAPLAGSFGTSLVSNASNIRWIRNNLNGALNPADATSVTGTLQTPSGGTGEWALTGNTRIYLTPGSLTSPTGQPKVEYRVGGGTPLPAQNCIATQETSAPGTLVDYVVADCYFRSINLGSHSLTVDTTHGKINFHFYDLPASPFPAGEEYIKGGGNSRLLRVQCSLPATPGTCTSPIQWTSATGVNFQTTNPLNPPFYNVSELFNIFIDGAGKITLNGSASAVGANVIAPFANVELIGGGSACSRNRPEPNFMGRIWSNNLEIKGDSCIRVVNSKPAFCKGAGLGGTESCGAPKGVPIFDVAVRSFTQASGF